ncbi:MAG: ParB/RepB/Spo0J family partition protein [Eubacterium sp.]|nr:ParB/RepB/Spo0J family partition protein [Eubacterium sp.]
MLKKGIALSSYDDIFETDASRKEKVEGTEIKEIPLELIDPFAKHPFMVNDDEDMDKLVASIRENGIINPTILSPKADGRYTIISGHRRKRACELLGRRTLTARVVNISEDEAVIQMVDSNLHREKIRHSEKAYAYKMKYEALKKRKGRPADGSSSGRTDELVGKIFGDSKDTVHRYMRLTYLHEDLLDMTDSEQIPFRAAVELSYLSPICQAKLIPFIEKRKISLSQAEELRRRYESGNLKSDDFEEILSGKKTTKPTDIKIKKIRSYFPPHIKEEDYEDYIIQAVQFYANNSKR